MRPIEAWLFDLDGTLVDTERLYVEATAAYLHERGTPLPHETVSAIVYGRSWADVYQSLREATGHLPPQIEVEEALRETIQHRKRTTDIRIPSSIALLKHLLSLGPVAVVSGSSRRDMNIHLDAAEIEIRDLAFFLGCEDYPRGKPDPAPYAIAAKRLGVPPAACMAFEDSHVGVCSAKAAGLRCIALVRPETPTQNVSAADWVVPDLSATLDHIDHWRQGRFHFHPTTEQDS